MELPVPELPEIETLRRSLLNSLLDERISSVEVLRQESIAYPDPKRFARLLPGHVFEGLKRRGKYLLINLSEGAGLVVHLRMSGRLLLVANRTKASKFLRVRLSLASRRELRFEDVRVFGRLWYVPPGLSFEAVVPALAHLGVEPLEGLTGRALIKLFAGKQQPIKNALLDQRLLAGVGNIYADESLFQAQIHPQTKAGKITPAQANRLVAKLKEVLNQAIAAGGSTLRDYTDSRGVNGNYQNGAWVYGRKSKPCLTCGEPIERLKLAGRSTHFCPNCQSSSRP